MRNIIFVVVFILIPVCGWGEERDISNYDGNEWRIWDSSHKVFFISGFISSTAYIVSENLISLSKNYNSKEAEKLSEEFYKSLYDKEKKDKNKKILFSTIEISLLMEQEKAIKNRAIYKYVIENITNGQIKDGLDVLYEDFKNRSIKITDAIYVVKKQIEGTPQDDIEKILLWLRGGKKDFTQLFVKNENGDFVRLIDFP